ncbi:uncharacterized protein LOC141905997 [Tubulanus polymorphus]|uniref:uncharacterized protein LOC141905997 n=1 Tax=Tubulanus polymorphus TaxID=672921 RepID=UPI003DA5EFE3
MEENRVNSNEFPEYHYPRPLASRNPPTGLRGFEPSHRTTTSTEHRMCFYDYGSKGFSSVSVTVNENDNDNEGDDGCLVKWYPQYPSVNCTFRGRKPSLPLTEPNSVNFPLFDVYSGEIENKRENLTNCYRSLFRKLGNTSNRQATPKIEIMEKWVRHLREFKDSNGSIDVGAVLTQVPSYVKFLARSKELFTDPYIPSVNHRYTGGCLNQFTRDDDDYLIYSSGKNLSQILVKKLSSSREGESEPIRLIDVDKVRYGESVTGLQHCCVQFDDLIVAKGDKSCSIYACDEHMKIELVREHVLNTGSISSIALSPHIAGEAVLTSDKRQVFTWGRDGRVNQVCDLFESRFTCCEDWTQVHYTAHPRCYCIADQTNVVLMDQRITNQRGIDLFILPNDLLLNYERIVSIHSLPSNPFYHLVNTDFTMSLIDERFPKHPALHWKQPLRCPVQYTDIIRDIVPDPALPDLLLASSWLNDECMCYPISTSETPRADKVGWRVSPMNRFTHDDSLIPHGVEKENVEKRVRDASLLGICGFKRRCDSRSVTVIQMSCFGDLFYQNVDLVAKEMDIGDRSAAVSLDQTSAEYCRDWLQRVHQQFRNKRTTADDLKFPEVDGSDSFFRIIGRQVAHVACPRCNPQNVDNLIHSTNVFSDSLCRHCGLDVSMDVDSHPDRFRRKVVDYCLDDGEHELNRAIGTDDPSDDTEKNKILIRLWNEEEIVYDVDKDETLDGTPQKPNDDRLISNAVSADESEEIQVNQTDTENIETQAETFDSSMDLFSTQLDSGGGADDDYLNENIFDDLDKQMFQSSQMNSNGWFTSQPDLNLATNSQSANTHFFSSTPQQQKPKKRKPLLDGF